MHRAPALSMTVLLLTLLFAGCVQQEGGPKGSVGTASDDPPSTVVVEPEPGIKIAENRGALRGSVRNDANLSVPEARVSLLNTDRFTDADAHGNFTFLNLTAGTYEIFIQSAGYDPLTEKVEVRQGQVATVMLFLTPTMDTGGEGRFHLHDFWAGRDQVVLMDSPVDLTTPRANGGGVAYSGPAAMTLNANGNSSERYRFWITGNGQDPPLVFPGTKEVLVKMTWTQRETTLERLGLAYNHTGGAGIGTPIYMPLQTSGSTWRIPVPPGAADDGHRAFSKWKFWVHTGPSFTASPTSRQPGLMLAPIKVEMTIVRGEVVPEPPHPDFWQGKTSLEILPRTLCQITGVISYTSSNRASGGYHCTIPTGIVPPGTTKLRVNFYWEYAGSTSTGPLANGSALDRDYVITWLTANQHPAFTPLDQYRRGTPVYENVAGHHKVYDIAVKSEDTDRYYDKRSGWVFLPSVKGEENDPEFEETRGRNYYFQITAFRAA